MECPISQCRAAEAKDEAIRKLNLWDIVAPNIFEVQISSDQPKNNGYIITLFRILREILATLVNFMIPLKNIPYKLLKKIVIRRRLPLKYRFKVCTTAKLATTLKVSPYPIRRVEAIEV